MAKNNYGVLKYQYTHHVISANNWFGIISLENGTLSSDWLCRPFKLRMTFT